MVRALAIKGQGAPQPYIPLHGAPHRVLGSLDQMSFHRWAGNSVHSILEPPAANENHRVILLGNKDGSGSSLYESFRGKGIRLNTSLNFSEGYPHEPLAAYLFYQMLQYLGNYQPEAPTLTALFADSTLRQYLDSLGLRAETPESADLSFYDQLIINAGDEATLDLLKMRYGPGILRDFVKEGGKLLIYGLRTQTFKKFQQLFDLDIRLTDAFLGEQSYCIKAPPSWKLRPTPANWVAYYDEVLAPQSIESNYDPLLNGIANRDLYWDGLHMFAQGVELMNMDPVQATPQYNILMSNWGRQPEPGLYNPAYFSPVPDTQRAYWFINRDPVLLKITEGEAITYFAS
ncbi:MAG: hypothetical protein HC880_01350 [Bacteroidia bacterium]|nr:hypothetical protein [Bacteroidia bacterium]